MNALKYTNGTGHLIMSLAMSIIGLCLILFTNDASTKAIGITLILTIQGAWFIPGAAKQVAYEVKASINSPTTPDVSPPTKNP